MATIQQCADPLQGYKNRRRQTRARAQRREAANLTGRMG